MLFYSVIAIVCILGISFVVAAKSAAPWVPMRSADVSRVLALAGDLKGKKFIDLGCGDGKTLFAAARAGAGAEGFEISLLPYFLARLRSFKLARSIRPLINFKSLWSADLRKADVVFVFLTPPIMPRLKEKLEKELKPGVLVVAYVWPFVGWHPEKINDDLGKLKLYLYKR
jgi:SAM-dependent methyltransferase